MRNWFFLIAFSVFILPGTTDLARANPVHAELLNNWFEKYLARRPNPGQEMYHWMSQFYVQTPMEVEAGILQSGEYYKNRASCCPKTFVLALFRDVLNEPCPPPQLVIPLAQQLQQCGCRQTVARTFLAQYVYGPTPYRSSANPAHLQQIDYWFQKYLCRRPGVGEEYCHWMGCMQTQTPLEVQAGILQSAEYFHHRAGCCPTRYVRALFRDVLNDNCPPSRLVQSWVMRLNACGCRQTIARSFLGEYVYSQTGQGTSIPYGQRPLFR